MFRRNIEKLLRLRFENSAELKPFLVSLNRLRQEAAELYQAKNKYWDDLKSAGELKRAEKKFGCDPNETYIAIESLITKLDKEIEAFNKAQPPSSPLEKKKELLSFINKLFEALKSTSEQDLEVICKLRYIPGYSPGADRFFSYRESHTPSDPYSKAIAEAFGSGWQKIFIKYKVNITPGADAWSGLFVLNLAEFLVSASNNLNADIKKELQVAFELQAIKEKRTCAAISLAKHNFFPKEIQKHILSYVRTGYEKEKNPDVLKQHDSHLVIKAEEIEQTYRAAAKRKRP